MNRVPTSMFQKKNLATSIIFTMIDSQLNSSKDSLTQFDAETPDLKARTQPHVITNLVDLQKYKKT